MNKTSITLKRTDSSDADFLALVRLLDADLAFRDGEDHAFFAQYNKVNMIRHCVVAYEHQTPVGCGAIKEFDAATMEVKRMYTLPGFRGRGIAVQVLNELEKWTAELGYSKCVLETGKKQPEAIALYTKCSYAAIPNYGQYADVESSVCFEKHI
jgi:GNAT superfamily N-acetyltransferase